MNEISSAKSYQCPEPILLIVGGDPQLVAEIGVSVFPGESEHIVLISGLCSSFESNSFLR